MNLSRHLLPVLIVMSFVGCSTESNFGIWRPGTDPGEPPHPLASLVSYITELPRQSGYTGGSAIKLPGNRLLTARHCLPEFAFGVRLDMESGRILDGIPSAVFFQIDGQRAEYRVLVAGDTTTGSITWDDSNTWDWAVIEVKGVDLSIPEDLKVEFDFEREVKPGEKILLIGFPNGELTIVETRVAKSTGRLGSPENIICVETFSKEVMHGMSGGAAVLWYPDEYRAVVLGNYRGSRQLEGFGIVWKGVQEVVRPPPDILNQE